MAFKIRKKPTKPTLKKIRKSIDLGGDFHIKDVIQSIEKQGGDVNSAYVDVTRDWDDCIEVEVRFSCGDNSEQHKLALEKYKEDLSKYKQWYKDNLHLIEEELHRREVEKQEKKRLRLEKAEAQLREKLEKVREKLDY